MTGDRERESFISAIQDNFVARAPNEELSARVDNFVATHKEPYSIADAMRALGRASSARPPAYIRPRIREILTADGVTSFFHPEITEETFRRICLVVGLPDPKMSEARKRYWQERGTEEKPKLNEQAREALHARREKRDIDVKPLPEDAATVQLIIEDSLQNSGKEIPQALVAHVRTFFVNNPRDYYLLNDLLEVIGITRRVHKAARRKTVKILEDQGLVRAWKTAPLLVPLPMAISACLEMISPQPKKEKAANPKVVEAKNKRQKQQKKEVKTAKQLSSTEPAKIEKETATENRLPAFDRHDVFGLGILFRGRAEVFEQFGIQLDEQDETIINRIIDPIIIERRKMGDAAPSLDEVIIPSLKEKLAAFSTGDRVAIMNQCSEEMRRLLRHIRGLHSADLESLLRAL